MTKDTSEPGPAGRLLAEIAPLTGPERMRHLGLYAREHRDGHLLAETAAGMDALDQPGLGAHLALAARDTDLVARYLNGPDEDLRHSVLCRTPGLPLPDGVLEELLDDASHRLRRTLYSALYRGHREAVADRLLPVVRERHGEEEATALLPACSTPTVDEHLDGLAHRVWDWGRLARRHPGPLLARLERELDTDQNPARCSCRSCAAVPNPTALSPPSAGPAASSTPEGTPGSTPLATRRTRTAAATCGA